MTASSLNKWPTCLACLRRLAQPFGTITAGHGGPRTPVVPVARPIVHTQIRAASHKMRLQDQGVVVRLLEDIPKFGRKHAIFRTERGRMRNEWFPKNKAEYMTPARFQQLGLTRDAIGEVDRSFVVLSALDAVPRSEPEEPQMEDPAPEVPAPEVPAPEVPVSQVRVPDVTPETAHSLLSQLIPNTLTFYRKPVPAPEPKATEVPQVSPLIARHVPAPTTSSNKIFSSVSSTDIFNQIKALVADHEEASRIKLAPSSVKILGLDKDNDRIKLLGRWDIEIAVPRAKSDVKPVRKSVEILPSAQ